MGTETERGSGTLAYDLLGVQQLAALLPFRDDHLAYLRRRLEGLQQDQEALKQHVQNLTRERGALTVCLGYPGALVVSTTGEARGTANGGAEHSPVSIVANCSAAAPAPADTSVSADVAASSETSRLEELQCRLSKTRMWRGPDAAQRACAALLILESGQRRMACAGTYEITTQVHNDYPVWKQRSGTHWLFGSVDGVFLVGNGKEVNVALELSGCILRSVGCHEGFMPHDVGVQQRKAGTEWVDDGSMVIRIHPEIR